MAGVAVRFLRVLCRAGVGPTEERHRVGWCSFTPGREHIVARVGCTVKVWDAVTYRTINTLHGHNDTVHWMALCPTANAIATASEDHTVSHACARVAGCTQSA